MKISTKWLNEFVDISDISIEELANKLTFAGVEVESIEKSAYGTNLVIGKIIECVPHPDSDHLHVLKVDEGKDGIHQIVCGAPNARVGLKVIVAKEGAVLPQVTIKPSVIRGVESDGMCCSLLELGVDKKFLSEKQTSGIEELDESAPIGENDVLGYLGLDDTILDISILPNRSDLYAMKNVAKEVGALLSRPVKEKEFVAKAGLKDEFKIETHTPKCPFIGIRIAKGVKIAPSPLWLQSILTRSGIRSINNVVDIGNYVMLLTGQPMNMYDLGKMDDYSLDVIDDYEGEFVAMDGNKYDLEKGDLLIVNKGKPMCLAGIMTSEYCAINEESKDIAVEAAIFSGASLRHTSARLGLSSDSSTRFTKGIDPNVNEYALEMASYLLEELCGASTGKTYYSGANKKERKTISSSLSYINGRLGTEFSMDEVVDVLTKDHLEIKTSNEDEFVATIPTYRIDMEGEADLSEEVIRLLGYTRINSKLPTMALSLNGRNEEQAKIFSIRSFLRNVGINEALTYSLISKEMNERFLILPHGEAYKLINPLTEDRQYYRRSLIPSLLDVTKYNLDHQAEDFSFFEISSVSSLSSETKKYLGMVLSGNERIEGNMKKRSYDFYSLKGIFEGIASILSLNEGRYRLESINDKEELHPGRSAGVYIGKNLVGYFGELHPTHLKKNGLSGNVLVMELDLSSLLSMKVSQTKASVPSKYPSVKRDLAFVLNKDITYGEVKREVSRIDRTIKKVDIFDLYEGEHVASDKKSMAISLTLLDEEKTLNDASVNQIIEKVISTLRIKFGAEIRS